MVIDKYLNLWFFVALNLVIIVLTETVGGGTWFYESGVIHIIAVVFVLLAGLRIAYHHYTYDPILEKFVHMCLAAMGVFALAHIVEFFSLVVLGHYPDSVYVNVANMYLISLLLIVIGAEAFLRVYRVRSAWLIWVAATIITALFSLSILILTNPDLVSLETDSIMPFLYCAAVLTIAIVALFKAWQIKKLVGLIGGFVNYLFVAVILISLAVLPNIFYEYLVHMLHVSEHQADYLSHFAFYAALSVLFLAFSRLNHLGGILDEVSQLPEHK